MMTMPYRMETVYTRIPYSNIVLVAIISLIYFLIAFEAVPEQDAEEFILRDWSLPQMIGSTFLHAGFFHLLGNMIFLWVFGNVVCATVGNIYFPILYLFLGVAASATHLAFDGHPALGASGAINGIVGMSLMLFPVNRLKCWYAVFIWRFGTFTVRAYWMIFAWAVFDILGVVSGGGNTAYWAHIGGFAMGMIVASCLILFNVVETYDPTFFDVLAGRPLERTRYTMEELAAMPMPGTGLGGVNRVTNVKQGQKEGVAVAPLANPIPALRVTRMVQKEKDLVIFFTNDGDPIRDVSLVGPEGTTAYIQPTKMIAKREIGSMRITDLSQQSLASADLKISYAVGSSRAVKQLHYDIEKHTLVVQ